MLKSKPNLFRPIHLDRQKIRAFLLDRYLLGVLLIGLLAILLAYQFRYPFSIQVGGQIDAPLFSHIHAPEFQKPDNMTFRWTTGDTEMILPDWGAGNPVELRMTVARWQPNDEIAELTLFVNGLEFDEPKASGQGQQEYRLPITDPTFLSSSNLKVRFETDTFIPKQLMPDSPDTRRLGIQLYSIKLTPLQNVNGNWKLVNGLMFAPFKLPPVTTGLSFMGSVLALYLGLTLFKIPRWFAFALTSGAAIAAAVGLVWVRPYLTLFADTFLFLMIISIGIGLLARAVAGRLLRWGEVHPSDWELNVLALLFAGAFLIKMAFLYYPQTISYDLLYHVHRIMWVMDGKFFWSIASGKNEFGGQDVPYLPSFYIFLAPFADWVDMELLVKLSGVLLDNVTIFFIYFLVKKYFNDGRAGLFAAWVYIITPLAFIAISWGIYANIFGQFLTLLLVVALIEGYDRLTTARGFIVIGGLFTLTMLSHTSVFASIVPMFAVWAALLFLLDRAWGKRPYWALIASILIAAAISYIVYYGRFVDLVATGTTTIASAASDPETRNMGDKGLTFWQLLQPARTEFIAVPFYIYGAMAAGFAWLAWQARRAPRRGRFLVVTMLVSWIVAFGVLIYLRSDFGFSSRYVNFAMPAIALCAGVAFSWVCARGLIGRLAALGVAALLGAQGLYHWYVLVMFKYH